MKPFRIALLMSAMFSATIDPSPNNVPSARTLSAPTYYVAAEVVGCEQEANRIEFRGATNLPHGALITAVVSDFDSDAWKDYSDEVHAPVSEQGFFAGDIEPKKGIRFHRNLLLRVCFAPFRPHQPEGVLKLIGKNGQKLQEVANTRIEVSKGFGRPAMNPQLIEWSGGIHGVGTIARVPHCGEQ
jgi:hypothetical protein